MRIGMEWRVQFGENPAMPTHYARIMIVAVVLACVCSANALVRAGVEPAPIFADHMVLQRNMPVAVWGTANAGEKVTVAFAGKSISTAAGADGKWRVQIGPLEANPNGEELLIGDSDAAGTGARKIEDVLVGEVWIGAGQSNMQGPGSMFLPGLKTSDQQLAKSPGDPNLRALIDAAPYPQVRIVGVSTNPSTPVPPQWRLADSQSLTAFSAQLQTFGILLHQKLNVPVGLMLAAIGGTPSGEWVSRSAFDADPACQAQIAKANQTFSMEREQKKYATALARYQTEHAEWEKLSRDERATRKEPGKPFPPAAPGEPTQSRWHIGELHDRVLGPYIGYGIRGVLWDQGESGTGIVGVDQSAVMGALIRGWRDEWKQGEFPFIYVQKPSGRGCAFDYSDKIYSWASDKFTPLPPTVPNDGENREMYIRLADYPSTFMSPTSDLGTNTHPWNKYGYGSRDLQVAMAKVYGEKIESSGPTFRSSSIEGNAIRVQFDHVGKGLTFRNGDKLQGFAIAGADRKFVWADAKIDGPSVIVSSAQIIKPAYVRYAWADNITWANLFNLDGLPGISFSTEAAK
jgi:sialate O-acetylesterase